MAEINVPIVTIPQLHDDLQTISATDLIPIVQGSEYDRDAAATLSEILASDAVKNTASWKTFTLSAPALDVSGWTRNAIVLPTVWLDSIAYSSVTIKNAIMIVAPKWASAGDTVTSCTFAQPEGSPVPILRGNILIVQFGADGKISSYFSLPASDVDSIAQFKNIAGKLVTADLVTTGSKQTADPESAEDIVGGVGGSGGTADSGAWWHFSGRGLFLKFFYSTTASVLFKLYRGAEGWLMSGIDKLSVNEIDVAAKITAPYVSVVDLVTSGTTTNSGAVINSGDVTNSGAVINSGGVTNGGTVINVGGVITNGDALNNGTVVNNGITKLQGNTLNSGSLLTLSQSSTSLPRTAIATISVPVGSKVLFFERHHSESAINHALGLYTDLSDGSSSVDSQAYAEIGDISATFVYTNSTEAAVTLYFMIGAISEGSTISYTNIHWNYLFL